MSKLAPERTDDMLLNAMNGYLDVELIFFYTPRFTYI